MKNSALAWLCAAACALGTNACAVPQDEAVTSSEEALSADEATYMVMFAYENQTTPELRANDARYSHTFATFVRARVRGITTPYIVEQRDVSWLPYRFTGTVCVDAFHIRCPPEFGHNYSLAETVAFARGMKDASGDAIPYKLAMWGPYRIRPELFTAAARQVDFLSGSEPPFYIANDTGTRLRAYRRGHGLPTLGDRSPGANNCVHAVTDIAAFERTGLLNWGVDGSIAAIDALRPYLVSRDADAEWIVPALGLDTRDVWR